LDYYIVALTPYRSHARDHPQI